MDKRKRERESEFEPAELKRMLMPIVHHGLGQMQAGARMDQLLASIAMMACLTGQGMDVNLAIRMVRRSEASWVEAEGGAPWLPRPMPYGGTPFGKMPSTMPPFGQMPFGQMPFGQMPFGQMPFGQMPFGQMPFGQMPFGPGAQMPFGPGAQPPFPPNMAPFAPWGGNPCKVQGAEYEDQADPSEADT